MSYLYPRPYLSHRNYPYPYGTHIHAELASIHHDQLLREQAELQRFARTNYQLQAHSRVLEYQAEIRQKQRRMAQLLSRGELIASLQKQKLNELKIEDELRYQQSARQMEVDRHLLLNKQIKNENISVIDKLATSKQDSREDHNGASSFYPKRAAQSQVNPLKNKVLQKSFELNNYQSAHLGTSQQPERHKLPQKNRKRVSFSIDNPVKKTFFERYSEESPEPLKSKPQKKEIIKNEPAKTSRKISSSVKNNAMQRINNRIRVSEVIYKDSEWRNIKHELTHLFSTYENQFRHRDELRKKINNTPQIIEKYSIVVDPK